MRKEVITHQDPKSPISEIFKTLRTNIQFMSTKGKLKTILVTSTLPGEGKSWVSSNLAVTFSNKTLVLNFKLKLFTCNIFFTTLIFLQHLYFTL